MLYSFPRIETWLNSTKTELALVLLPLWDGKQPPPPTLNHTVFHNVTKFGTVALFSCAWLFFLVTPTFLCHDLPLGHD